MHFDKDGNWRALPLIWSESRASDASDADVVLIPRRGGAILFLVTWLYFSDGVMTASIDSRSSLNRLGVTHKITSSYWPPPTQAPIMSSLSLSLGALHIMSPWHQSRHRPGSVTIEEVGLPTVSLDFIPSSCHLFYLNQNLFKLKSVTMVAGDQNQML